MAGKDFGGTMRFRDSAGRNIALRGTFNINPATVTVEGMVNQDGSADRVGTPAAPHVEIAFADKGVDLAAIMFDDRRNVTITENFTGVSHLLTNAFWTGDPQTNRMTGEVTGAGLMAESYRRA